jgi:hypothetical protein
VLTFLEQSTRSKVESSIINKDRWSTHKIPEIHPLLTELIKSCWQRDPEIRPNIGQVIENLNRIIAELAITINEDRIVDDGVIYLQTPSESKEEFFSYEKKDRGNRKIIRKTCLLAGGYGFLQVVRSWLCS